MVLSYRLGARWFVEWVRTPDSKYSGVWHMALAPVIVICIARARGDAAPRLVPTICSVLGAIFDLRVSHVPCFARFTFCAGGIQSPVAFWGWVVECIGAQHVLWIMWMAHPNQADRPQGSHHVSDGILVANDLDIGSGWQQSKQNWARPAVVGH